MSDNTQSTSIHESRRTNRFDGKVAIITGGNSGIGAGTVELFVKPGRHVSPW